MSCETYKQHFKGSHSSDIDEDVTGKCQFHKKQTFIQQTNFMRQIINDYDSRCELFYFTTKIKK